jgi:signal transduction histidine kinase
VEKALQQSEKHQVRLLKQAQHLQAQLRLLSHQTLQVQEEERKRISRELHDEIAQTLVGINVRLAALAREAEKDPKDLTQKIERTQRLVEASVELVHRFARELRPTMLDDLGLIPALHSFMKGFTERTGIRVRFKTFATYIEELDNDTRTVLYRVALEALTNVARHAEASVVNLSVERIPDGIRLTVQDDGKSFQADRVLHAKRPTRLGLIGMRERLQMVGGRFQIDSAPGLGTTVRAEIPTGRPGRVQR